MTHTRSDIPTTSQLLPPRQRSWLVTLLSQRSVQVTLLAWLMANALLVMLSQDKLPFDRPALGGISVAEQVVSANLALVEVFLLIRAPAFCESVLFVT